MADVTMHITLPSECERFVQEQVQSGRFRSASDVVRVALERLAAVSTHGTATPLRTLGGAPYRVEEGMAAIERMTALCADWRLPAGVTIDDLIQDGRAL
jgi:putative addiction module CopG family antidote